MLLALLVCAILLTPYLYFQMERDFQDLKAFVVGKSLINEHMTVPNRFVDNSANALSETVKSWGVSVVRAPKELLQLLVANLFQYFGK